MPLTQSTPDWTRWYDPNVPASIEFEQKSLPQYLRDAAADHPEVAAIVFENSRITYAELDDYTNRLATALAGLGVSRGTRVGIQLPNLPQTVIAYYAVLKLGAQVVMTNPLNVEREIIHQWNDARVHTAIVGDWLYKQRVEKIRGRLCTENFIVTGIADFLRFPLRVVAPLTLRWQGLSARVRKGEGVYDFRELLESTATCRVDVAIDLDDVAALQYTSAVTGKPKGAMLTHRNLSFNVQQTRAWFSDVERGREVFLACLPYFHVFGMTVSMNLPISVAASMVLMPNPREIGKIVGNLHAHRVTMLPAVPALFKAIVHHPKVRKFDLSSIKGCFSGSEPLPVDVIERFESMTGSKISEGFGMTETSPVTLATPMYGVKKPGSVGVPLPNTEVLVVHPEYPDRVLPPGETGELIVRGPQCMKGYWNMPEATAETLRDGWIFTGDLARIDEDGFCWIVGRKKEVIIVNGLNVYPNEVDEVLSAHPKVVESGTIGLPDARSGERVKSFVVLRPGETATESAIREYCRSELARYKVPREIEFRTELPKNAMQKLLRRELCREQY